MSTDVTTAVGKFVWHEQHSSDPKQAQSFYTQLLGWELEVWKPGEVDYAMISSGGQTHGGFGEAQGGAPPHWIGHVLVGNADETAEKAKAAGGTIVAGPIEMPEVGKFVVIADPQGAVVSAYQAAGDGPVGQGVFVWDELVTSDVEAAKRFYAEVFGWTSRDADMGVGFTYTMFKRDDVDVAGGMPLGDIPASPHWLVYMATDNVDETAARAKELGGTVMRDPFDIEGIGRIAILLDPTGAAFGLFQPAS